MAYQIARSLRFRSGGPANLTRTQAAGTSRQKFTFSWWDKKGTLSTRRTLFCGPAASLNSIEFSSADAIEIYSGGSSGNVFDIIGTAALRDPAVADHFVVSVDTTQATAANRITVWKNNVQMSFTGTYPAQAALEFNDAGTATIGVRSGSTSFPYDGYVSDVWFVDNLALTPSSFGQVNSVGTWEPKAYTGAATGNSYHLDFSDNSSLTNLGLDRTANGNNWTLSNFSITAGTANDSVTDTPTNYGTDTGLGGEVRGNFATLNPLASAGVYSDANLTCDTTYGLYGCQTATIGLSSGKWYWETIGGVGSQFLGGIQPINPFGGTNRYFPGYDSTNPSGYAYGGNGVTYHLQVNMTTGLATIVATDVVGYALDLDNGTLSFYKNNTLIATITASFLAIAPVWFPAFGDGNNSLGAVTFNFGQRAFAYQAPSGYKAICTQNISDPVIKKPSQYMDINLRTGTGAAANVTGKGFQPDLIISKRRDASGTWATSASGPGVGKYAAIETTAAEITDAQAVTAFNSDGFSIGTSAALNTNTGTYVDWLFKKGVTQGYDQVLYTGDNTANKNISHALGVAPKFAIIKRRDSTSKWWAYQQNLTGPDYYFDFGATTAQTNTTGPFGTGNWSATQFMVSNGTENANAAGGTYEAHLFAEIPGFSKFGFYTGNAANDGPFCYCGFRPKLVIIKDVTGSLYTVVLDDVRNPFNVANSYLFTALAQAEAASGVVNAIDILSNGFKVRDAGANSINTSTNKITFMAFADVPFKYSAAPSAALVGGFNRRIRLPYLRRKIIKPDRQKLFA